MTTPPDCATHLQGQQQSAVEHLTNKMGHGIFHRNGWMQYAIFF
jgi:hypothetical protein